MVSSVISEVRKAEIWESSDLFFLKCSEMGLLIAFYHFISRLGGTAYNDFQLCYLK